MKTDYTPFVIFGVIAAALWYFWPQITSGKSTQTQVNALSDSLNTIQATLDQQKADKAAADKAAKDALDAAGKSK